MHLQSVTRKSYDLAFLMLSITFVFYISNNIATWDSSVFKTAKQNAKITSKYTFLRNHQVITMSPIPKGEVLFSRLSSPCRLYSSLRSERERGT